jgi:hypothetical protein
MNPFWARILDFFCLHQKTATRVLILGCSLAMLCAVGGIVWYFVSPDEPPDPAASDLHEIAEYIKSDSFLEKSSLQRGEYTNRLVQRYQRMSEHQRREAQKEFGELFRKNRTVEKAFWLSFMSKQADHYDKLSPENRERFLDQFILIAETMHGRHRAREDFKKKSPLQKNVTPKMQRQAFYRMQKNIPLLLNQTTAEDRAKMSRLAGDMIARMKKRYDE